ncbi:hypothetical protein MPTK1_6g07960 [Marchantia polymorpha subsp. ruderalis]|uniref:Uncharacterized protein n=2 Tax=Marchantia polymorpha TaxID=3197 RepID=A0AAF6BPQ4_MARPO|nr:hypothetical protein MARPO_0239s0001 [Marchantia polymorpha]BBN13988.1 hypothetical protein Mp_6g07960 [Marchantia polymorpha subsp. ruderalis]|eukprot:PTQ27024.1 hypothetical protein MARPO_0239s0001 [Marchantia polymorpha]
MRISIVGMLTCRTDNCKRNVHGRKAAGRNTNRNRLISFALTLHSHARSHLNLKVFFHFCRPTVGYVGSSVTFFSLF